MAHIIVPPPPIVTEVAPIATHDLLLLGTMFAGLWLICLYGCVTEFYNTLMPWRVGWQLRLNCNWVAGVAFAVVGLLLAPLAAYGLVTGFRQLLAGF